LNLIKLFVSDLDGTLLGTLSENLHFSRLWTENTSKRNPGLVYSTGRLLADTQQLVSKFKIPEPDFIISGVGTQIYDTFNNSILEDYSDLLKVDWDRKIVDEVISGLNINITKQPNIWQSDLKSSWYLENGEPDQLALIQENLMNTGLKFSVVYSSNRDLDILPKNANKGRALSWLLKFLHISPEETVVAGDSGNDREMFQINGVRGILVGNAQPELFQLAVQSNVYCSNAFGQFGVIEGLTHYGLFEKNENIVF